MLVTRTKLCENNYQPKRGFGNLETPAGIGIGSTEKEVIATYGKPYRIGTSEQYNGIEKGLKTLVYSEAESPWLKANFFLKDNVVHSILISTAE
jgi:hypothetical protein